MTVLYRAILACRMWGWRGEVPAEHLADLMDAIHNLPELIQHWEQCDVELLRGMLGDYERKWLDRGGLALLKIFDGIVAGEVI
jgi:hypothetical protein